MIGQELDLEKVRPTMHDAVANKRPAQAMCVNLSARNLADLLKCAACVADMTGLLVGNT